MIVYDGTYSLILSLIFRGNKGSGTIFFTSCNMRCAFCQNGDINTDKDNGISITSNLLALMIWQLRMEGCHNTNWVGGDPTIHLHTIVRAISILDSFKSSRLVSVTGMKDFGSVGRSVGYAADKLLEISRLYNESSIKRNPYIRLLYSCSFLHLIISDQLYLSGKSPSRNDARAIRKFSWSGCYRTYMSLSIIGV